MRMPCFVGRKERRYQVLILTFEPQALFVCAKHSGEKAIRPHDRGKVWFKKSDGRRKLFLSLSWKVRRKSPTMLYSTVFGACAV